MFVSVQPHVGAQCLCLCSHMWGLSVCVSAATCGGSVFAANGSITSPNFPANYDNNLDCEWTIHGPTGHFLTLTFETFQLQRANCSTHDYVEIRDFNVTGVWRLLSHSHVMYT